MYIIIINILLSILYTLFFKFPSNIVDITNFCPNIFWEMCFIPDTREYTLRLPDFNLDSIIDNFILLSGGISHHLILYFFSTQENIILYSIILNSIIAGLIIKEIKIIYNTTSIYRSYFFLLPFFLLYSIGPTKEILLFYGSLLILRNKSAYKIFFGIMLVAISRNVFLPILIISKLIKLNMLRFFLIIISISIILPFTYKFIGFNFYEYDQNKLPQFIEALKYELPIISILGLLVNFLKNFFEPLTYLLKDGVSGLTNLVLMINLFYFSYLYYLLFKYRFHRNIYRSKEFVFLILSTIFLTTYPLVQQRYLLIPGLMLIFYINSVLTGSIAKNVQ